MTSNNKKDVTGLSLTGIDDRRRMIPFSKEEYKRRLSRVRELMAIEKIELLFVTSPESMCYLHGYEARWYRSHSTRDWWPMGGTAIHVNQDKLIHFDMAAEEDLLNATSVTTDIRYYPDEQGEHCIKFLIRELKSSGWIGGKVGLELFSYLPNRIVSEKTQEAFESQRCEVIDGTGIVLEARKLKSPAEIEILKRAAKIVDIGLKRVSEVLAPGITELEIWGEMMLAMAKAGGEPAGLHELVTTVAGHGFSSRRPVQENEIIAVDPCGVYARYHVNSARMFWIGTPPESIIDDFKKSGGAYKELEKCIKPGVPVADVNKQMRAYYQDVGLWDRRMWIGGYELGISFPPDWVGESIFTVEDQEPSGTFELGYVSNFESMAGSAMVDTFVVEETGATVLGTMPFELIVI